MKRLTYLLAIIVSAILIACLPSACSSSSDPSTLKTYNLGRDRVTSITSVVGERTVKSVETEGRNEFPSIQYAYQSSTVIDDLFQYLQLLPEQGWTMAGEGYDLEESAGSAQFVKESVDNGNILVLLINYDENGYAIKVTKLEATIANLSSDGE